MCVLMMKRKCFIMNGRGAVMKRRSVIFVMSVLIFGGSIMCAGCNEDNPVVEKVIDEVQDRRVSKHSYNELRTYDKVYYIEKAINENDVDKIYDIFSEDVKQEVGEDELLDQIKEWMSAFDGNASLTYLESSERDGVDNDSYYAYDKVDFAYRVNDTDYECMIMSVDASRQSQDYVGTRFILSIKSEILNSGEYTFKDYDTPGVAIID